MNNTDKQNKNEQQFPVLFLQSLLYPFLVSVSPGIKNFSHKAVLKF